MTTQLTGAPTPVVSLALPNPIVLIPKEVYDKITHWVKKGASHECSGMGKVVIDGTKIKIVDAWMVKQKNSGGDTEMDGDHLAKLMYNKRDVPGTWSFWWHSHANMSTFWSYTDKDQIAKIANNGLCIATVFNTRGETRTCVASSSPFPFHVDEIKIEVEEDPINAEKIKSWDFEYDDNVTKQATYGSIMWPNEWEDEYYNNRHNGGREFGLNPYAEPPRGSVSSTLQEREKAAQKREEKIDSRTEENWASETDVERSHERLRECYQQLDTLEQAYGDGEITKEVCEILGIIYEPGLNALTELETGEMLGVELEEAMIALDEEIDIIRKGLTNAARTNNDKNGTHITTDRPNTH